MDGCCYQGLELPLPQRPPRRLHDDAVQNCQPPRHVRNNQMLLWPPPRRRRWAVDAIVPHVNLYEGLLGSNQPPLIDFNPNPLESKLSVHICRRLCVQPCHQTATSVPQPTCYWLSLWHLLLWLSKYSDAAAPPALYTQVKLQVRLLYRDAPVRNLDSL